MNIGKNAAIVGLLLIVGPAVAESPDDISWPYYGNDPGGARYSLLSQINRTNVTQLRVAWKFRTGALRDETYLNRRAAFETTPLLFDRRLYLSTPYDHVIALDPASGEKLWEYDPRVDLSRDYSVVASRGVAVWQSSGVNRQPACSSRIFIGTLDARLIALDAQTGLPCMDFGTDGQVDLTPNPALHDPDHYHVTSAPAIAGDLVIVGSSIADNRVADAESGIVRAYEARSGKLAWSWDPIPWVDQLKFRSGAGNAWSTMSTDPERDLVFIPTGSPSPDHFGGLRKGDNKWANSVVALRASTGQFVWGFQVVHHDLWDYDVASQPTLFTWRDGTPAIAITTKMGRIFVLDRRTGVPLLPVEERPVPQSDVAGEQSSPTQPASLSILSEPKRLGAEDAWGVTPQARQWCAEKIKALRFEGIFTPPSLNGSIQLPGIYGGINWGSSAFDPERHFLFMNVTKVASVVKLVPQNMLAAEIAQHLGNHFGTYSSATGAPYAVYREDLVTPNGVPCNAPPWGTIAAVDLFSGEQVWDVALGGSPMGPLTGSPNAGGPIVTAGGLVIVGAAKDNYLRALDSDTGKELWRFELPAGGQATPMTYSRQGKQYLVIAAGGHGAMRTKQGDYLIAFSLP